MRCSVSDLLLHSGVVIDDRGGVHEALLGRDADGNLVRKSGIMSTVHKSGGVRPGDAIKVELPPEPHRALGKV